MAVSLLYITVINFQQHQKCWIIFAVQWYVLAMVDFLQHYTENNLIVESFYAHRVWISESLGVCRTKSSNAFIQSRNTTV